MKFQEQITRNFLSSRFSTLPVLILSIPLLGLTACTSKLDRLGHVSNPTPMTQVYDPTTQPNYKPITWPMPTEEAAPDITPIRYGVAVPIPSSVISARRGWETS